MRVIVDTNVFVSGVFFGGIPGRILEAWRHARIQLVLSAEILDEYRRVGQALAAQHPGVDLGPFLGLLMVHAEIVEAPPLADRVALDPDDDKFLACAIAAGLADVRPTPRRARSVAGLPACRRATSGFPPGFPLLLRRTLGAPYSRRSSLPPGRRHVCRRASSPLPLQSHLLDSGILVSHFPAVDTG